MVDLTKIREAIWTLKRMGIGINSFYASSETIAELQSADLTVIDIQTGNTRWLITMSEDNLGRGVGSRHVETLAGIPLERRDK